MSRAHGPISLVAERAVRLLRTVGTPLSSCELAFRVLSIRISRETRARRILDTAFSGDPRILYRSGSWDLAATKPQAASADALSLTGRSMEPDKVWLLLQGQRPTAGQPFKLEHLDVIRVHGDEIVAACGGEPGSGTGGALLRRTALDTIEGAVPFVHEPGGAVSALERWLDEPLEDWVDLRHLGRDRLGLAARHKLADLAAALELDWCESDDPLERVETLERCLESLRQPEETLEDLYRASWPNAPDIKWSELAFDPKDLRNIPHAPGVYRFFDRQGSLLYIGKSRDLHRRLQGYFQSQRRRSPRVTRILSRLYDLDYEVTGSELEALLHEARSIAQDDPSTNIQRRIHSSKPYREKLRSMLILEPAAAPAVLRAYLVRKGRWVGKVSIGPRGGGLKRIHRLLEAEFFETSGSQSEIHAANTSSDLIDLELVTRWLAANRDHAVTFDPTDLKTAEEVILRLKFFLRQGEPSDPDGLPFLGR